MPWLGEVMGTVRAPEGHAWADGCGKCQHGLIDPPPTTGVPHVTRLDVRVHQAHAKLLTYCDCKAGEQYLAFLRREFKRRLDGQGYNLTIHELKKLQDYMVLQAKGQEPSFPTIFRQEEQK